MFTRIVTDLNAGFDEIRAGYQGPLFLEVVPRSFAIKVKTGQSLNQIRFVRGEAAASDAALQHLHRQEPLLYHNLSDRKPLRHREFRTDRGLSCASTSRATSAPTRQSSGTEPRKTVM